MADTRHNGAAIRTFRVIRGKSRDDLAQAAGSTYPHIANVENEHKEASAELIHRIAIALDVPAEALLRRAIFSETQAAS